MVVRHEFEDGWCSVQLLQGSVASRGERGVRLLVDGIVPRSYLGIVKGEERAGMVGSRRAVAGEATDSAPDAQNDRHDRSRVSAGMKGAKKSALAQHKQHYDDPDVAYENGKDVSPVLSLLRKKSLSDSWRQSHAVEGQTHRKGRDLGSASAGRKERGREGILKRSPSPNSVRTAGKSHVRPRVTSDEDGSVSTTDSEDEATKRAAAARIARAGSPHKPPLPGRPGKPSPHGSGGGSSEKEKRKSLLSRNPRKMIGKIAAHVRSRSGSREPVRSPSSISDLSRPASREASPAIDL